MNTHHGEFLTLLLFLEKKTEKVQKIFSKNDKKLILYNKCLHKWDILKRHKWSNKCHNRCDRVVKLLWPFSYFLFRHFFEAIESTFTAHSPPPTSLLSKSLVGSDSRTIPINLSGFLYTTFSQRNIDYCLCMDKL